MRKKHLFFPFSFPLVVAILASVYSCANMARPSGGMRDTIPPVFLRSTPINGVRQFNKNKIEIQFDEIVLVENIAEKVVVSPPQIVPPKIRTNGKKIIVELEDSLKPNTTYTIDFTDAIVDNNEKNPLPGYTFAFSTGNTLDTLEVSGYLLESENLEPITGMLVGIVPAAVTGDSAFIKFPLERISISDIYGKFTIKNIAPGSYRVYALKDANRDYRFDNPSESLAFLDSLVVPSMERVMHQDTLWKDSLTVDTIISALHTHYFPNDIILRSFNEKFKAQYLDKTSRTEPHKLTLQFAAAALSLPSLRPLNFEAKDWAVIEANPTKDTLTYWIKDSSIYKLDSLQFEAKYLRTDSLQQLTAYTDTLLFEYIAPRKKAVEKKKKRAKNDTIPEVIPIDFLKLNVNFPSSLDLYSLLTITSEEPLSKIDASSFHLETKVDTLWKPVVFNFEEDSLLLRRYKVQYKWKPDTEYRFRVDSATVVGLYGKFNNKIEQVAKTKKLEEYANLFVEIPNVADSTAFVELLNGSDQPVRKALVKKGGALIRYITPGKYYLRLVEDANRNGKYDTGNYLKRLQPEMVYYFNGELKLKPNWDVEQKWDINELPIYSQKPKIITKNKPKELTPKKNEEEEEDPNALPYNFIPGGGTNDPNGSYGGGYNSSRY